MLTAMASACAVESQKRPKFVGLKSSISSSSSSNNNNSKLSCRRRNESADNHLSDSSGQCLVIEPRHSQALEISNSNAAVVVFSEILSCATRTSHSDDSCCSVQDRAQPSIGGAGVSSPFPRFPRDSNCNHGPEARPFLPDQRPNANSQMQQIYDDLETAGHNSQYQWHQQQQQQQQQRTQQYWQPLQQQSNQRQQTQKQQQPTQFRPMKQHPQPCQGQRQRQQRQQQPPAVPPTQRPGQQKRQPQRVAGSPGGIYSPARARNTSVHHHAEPPTYQFGSVSAEDGAVPGGRPLKLQKRPKFRQHPAQLQKKPKQPLGTVSAQRQQQPQQQPKAAPAAPRCARCPSKPRPCPMKQRRLLKKRQKKRQRKQKIADGDCAPGEASCGDCQPPRIVLCPAKRGRENFSRVKLQTQPGRFITRQVLFFDGSYLYKPVQPKCP